MYESPVGAPKGKTKTKCIHQGRKSLESTSCSSTITVDSKDSIPSHFTPSKGSCHDICKYGCKRDPKSRSWYPDGKSDLLKSKRLSGISLDSITKSMNQVKRPNQSKLGVLQMKPAPWRTQGSSSKTPEQSRRFSEIIIPNRYQYIEKDCRIKNGEVKCRKKEQALPKVTRYENSSTNKLVKKQNATSKEKPDKCIEDHVPEKILHVIEPPKVESERNEAIRGTICTDSSFSDLSSSNEGTLKNEVVNSPRDSDNSPGKVKFRKGKTISIQQDDNYQWEIKFRQKISLVENQNCNVNLTVKSPNRGDAPSNRIMVKLRSQTFEGKQGSQQGSYNSLIEDTSNRMVNLKKGTVMALVKAFENVISIENSQTAM